MKKTNKNTSNEKCYVCTRAHKVWSWIALCGIFVCGMMTGVSLWGYKHVHTADSAVQSNLGAANYEPITPPCQMRENALLANLVYNINDSSFDAADNHKHNADIYDKLVKWGCEKNIDRYQELKEGEYSAWDVLTHLNPQAEETACKVVEDTLLKRVQYCDSPECHLENAEIYSKIVEDGCEESKDRYAHMALAELQIAEGVRLDDSRIDEYEIRSTINTYKKLQMQNEAKKYIKKVEKLVNPGIDFIMELQRVIEE